MKQILVLLLLIVAFNASGTMSTDDTRASQAEASLSGFRKDGLEKMEEQEERNEPMTMEDASSVEFDPDDQGVYEIEPEQTDQQ